MRLLTWSLRSRLFGLVLIALLPAFALIAWHQGHHVEENAANALEQLSGIARTGALAQQRLLESARLLLVGLSEAPVVRGMQDKQCRDYLARLRERIPYAANLGVADLQGNLRCSAVPAAPGVNIADRAYFRDALARDGFAVGEYQLGRATGTASLGFGLPVRNAAGKVHGVAFLAFDLDVFARLTEETPLPDGAVMLTADSNGVLLSVRPAGMHKLGAKVDWPALDRLIQDHGNETRELRAADGTVWLYATVEVHVGGSRALSVAIGAPRESVVEAARRAAAQELALLAIALAAALGLAWAGYERAFVRPVRGFLHTVRRIARGELAARAPDPGPVREFAEIREAFNAMAAALEERDRRLAGLLEVSADWYWEQDADLRFTAFSGNLSERGDFDVNEFVGRRRWEIAFEDVSEDAWREHRALTEARQPFRDFLVSRRDPKGNKHYLSISGRPRFDQQGRFAGYTGVTRDVTAVRASEGRYRALFELSPDAVFVHAEGRIVLINASGARLYGAASPQALQGASIVDLVAESHRERVRERLQRLDREEGALPIAEIPQRRLDGSTFIGEVYTTPYEGEGRRSYVTEVRDVTARHQMENALRESEAQYRTLFEKSPIPMWVFSLENLRFLAVNDAAVANYGYTREEFLAMTIGDIRTPEEMDKVRAAIQGNQEPFRDAGIWRHRRKDGTAIDVHIDAYGVTFQGKVARLVLATDVTERLKYEARIEYLATHDGLTSLPNRNLFSDRLAQAITLARRAGQRVGVLLLDLDNFKMINDSFGHGAGDLVVQGVAQRLAGVLRAGDTVARFGGDEFVVLLTALGQAEDSALVVRKIQDALAAPFRVEGTEVFVTASLGVSTFPADGDDMATLLRNADVAMYKAKELGRNGVQFFASDFSTRAVERLEMEAGLRRALERHEFEIHYQPQVDLYTRRIFSAEALIRWRHPQRGLVPPGQFIQAAEDTGLIVPIGNWMLRAACTQLTQWRAAGLPALKVSVNVSARQFRDKTLAENVRDALAQAGVEPALLELELTEGLAMGNVEGFVATLGGLKSLGIGIAIDDFGTGYSSLSYLKRFPIDKLKIDQSFVRNLPAAEDDASIVRTVIALARSLRLRVIAEGVETWEQLEFLRLQACDEVQGYYFCRPVPAGEFARLLEAGLPPALWLPPG